MDPMVFQREFKLYPVWLYTPAKALVIAWNEQVTTALDQIRIVQVLYNCGASQFSKELKELT